MTRTLKTFFISLAVLSWSVAIYAQNDSIRISTDATTHLVFASELTYVDIANRVIVAKVVPESRNILRLKAAQPFDFTTTLSALESTGKLHTFIVSYDKNPVSLIYNIRLRDAMQPEEGNTVPIEPTTPEDVLERPRELYHIGARKSGIDIYCENIFVAEEDLYFVFSIRNRSNIKYEVPDPTFMQESARSSKRSPDTEKELRAANRYGSIVVSPKATERICYRIPRFTLGEGTLLRIYFYENKGSRNLSLTIAHKDINDTKQF